MDRTDAVSVRKLTETEPPHRRAARAAQTESERGWPAAAGSPCPLMPPPSEALLLQPHFKHSPWINAARSREETQAPPPPPPPPPPPVSLHPPLSPAQPPTPPLRLTAPGTRLLKCIFNSATLKWHSGKCTQSIINEIISL